MFSATAKKSAKIEPSSKEILTDCEALQKHAVMNGMRSLFLPAHQLPC